MSLRSFMIDTVSLVKRDGRRIDNIKASVQTKKIYIDDGSLPIEEGDTITRTLPNGLEEEYRVIDRGYFGGMGGIKAHYQIEVRKTSRINTERPATVIYNLNGANPRVNNNSVDASMNVVSTSPDHLFDELRKAIESGVEDSFKKSELLSRVSDLESTRGMPTFLERYKAFVALAADHWGLMQPFVPALTQMLGS